MQQYNEQIIELPLLSRDMNKTFHFTKKASPYCKRIKEVGRRQSLIYCTEERNTKNILLCQGSTFKIDLKAKTTKPKQRTYSKINRTTFFERITQIDISPWENLSP